MGYKLYFANANLSTVGPAVATVTAAQVSSSTCGCDSDRYSVTMNRVDIPSGATGFMVVIVDVYDFELPLGTYIGGLVDIWTSTTTTGTSESETSESVTATTTTTNMTTTTTVTLKPIVSGAGGRRPGAVFVGLAAALWLALSA